MLTCESVWLSVHRGLCAQMLIYLDFAVADADVRGPDREWEDGDAFHAADADSQSVLTEEQRRSGERNNGHGQGHRSDAAEGRRSSGEAGDQHSDVADSHDQQGGEEV